MPKGKPIEAEQIRTSRIDLGESQYRLCVCFPIRAVRFLERGLPIRVSLLHGLWFARAGQWRSPCKEALGESSDERDLDEQPDDGLACRQPCQRIAQANA